MEPFHAYIDAHSQILIYGCPGYVVQDISRMQTQCKKHDLCRPEKT